MKIPIAVKSTKRVSWALLTSCRNFNHIFHSLSMSNGQMMEKKKNTKNSVETESVECQFAKPVNAVSQLTVVCRNTAVIDISPVKLSR